MNNPIPDLVRGPAVDSGRKPLVALTGATGFIGRRLVPTLARAGLRVRVLMRRDPVIPEWLNAHPQVVAGSLGDERALERLVAQADTVIHLAGLVKAARGREFFSVNRDGAAALARTVQRAVPGAHFVLVSSLAAREPQLSDYAASKREAEDAVRALLGRRVTVVRPTAVYGPGDRETLAFFRIARLPRVPLIGARGALATLIHVDDLSSLIAAIAAGAPRDAVVAATDDRPDGYGWQEIFSAAARAVGHPRARFMQLPLPILRMAALAGDLGRAVGTANMLSSQKLRELRHPDWTVSAADRASPPGWVPRFDLDAGFADAVGWYRRAGWL